MSWQQELSAAAADSSGWTGGGRPDSYDTAAMAAMAAMAFPDGSSRSRDPTLVPAVAAPAVASKLPSAVSAAARRHPYQAQFTSTTQLILTRLKRGNGDLAMVLTGLPLPVIVPPVKDVLCDQDPTLRPARRSLNTPSPLTPKSPTLPELAHHVGTLPLKSSGTFPQAISRKRKLGTDAPDGYALLAPAAVERALPRFILALPLSKSRLVRLGIPAASRRCAQCRETASTRDDVFLTCRSCSGTWHQECHNSLVVSGLAQRPRKWFFCNRCEPDRPAPGEPYRQGVSLRQRRKDEERIEALRARKLAELPSDVVAPSKSRLVGFTADNASDHARSTYFAALKKTDRLNLLSFCDQLRPDLLTDLLVSVSKKHPDMPMFGSPGWSSATAAYPAVSRLPTSGASATRNGGLGGRILSQMQMQSPATSLNPKAKKKSANRRNKTGHSLLLPKMELEDDADGIRYGVLLPEAWPKPGEGVYATLPLESTDPMLADHDDTAAFSSWFPSLDELQTPPPSS